MVFERAEKFRQKRNELAVIGRVNRLKDHPTPFGDVQEHDFPAEDKQIRRDQEGERERKRQDDSEGGKKSDRNKWKINSPEKPTDFGRLVRKRRLVGIVGRNYRRTTIH